MSQREKEIKIPWRPQENLLLISSGLRNEGEKLETTNAKSARNLTVKGEGVIDLNSTYNSSIHVDQDGKLPPQLDGSCR